MNDSMVLGSIEPGTRIAGSYQVLSLLGAGGMSSVYMALDTDEQCPVALKFLLEQKFSDDEAVERFRHEFSVLEVLDHQNVIKGYDLLELPNGGMCMVLEYVEGTTLSDLIYNSDPPISFELRVKLLKNVCAGLLHAHGHGIIHRDLKPENVLVTAAGQAKLLDFGIACEDKNELEATGTAGTPYYMSPEQHHGDLVDCRTDIYSLGVLAYELFAGARPFEDKTAFKLFVSHVAATVPSARAKNPELPKWIDTLIELSMEKKPEHRFQSVEEFLDFLDCKLQSGDNAGWLKRLIGW